MNEILGQVISILAIFFLAVFAVRTKIFQPPQNPKYPEKTEGEIRNEIKNKVGNQPIDTTIEQLNERYSDKKDS